MKYFYALTMFIMLAFAALQYNDPDGLYWSIVYLVPAIALGFAAFNPDRLRSTVGRVLLLAAVLVLVTGTYVYWPTQQNFWMMDVWWDQEPVKEGMGVMIALLFTCTTLLRAFSSNKVSATPASANASLSNASSLATDASPIDITPSGSVPAAKHKVRETETSV